MKNYWIDNRVDYTFIIKDKKGIELLSQHDVKLSYLSGNRLEVIFTDDDFDQNLLLEVDGTSIGYLTYYDITGKEDASWTLHGLYLDGIVWCEFTKPLVEIFPRATFSFDLINKIG